MRREQRNRMPASMGVQGDAGTRAAGEDVGDAADTVDGRQSVAGSDEDIHARTTRAQQRKNGQQGGPLLCRLYSIAPAKGRSLPLSGRVGVLHVELVEMLLQRVIQGRI